MIAVLAWSARRSTRSTCARTRRAPAPRRRRRRAVRPDRGRDDGRLRGAGARALPRVSASAICSGVPVRRRGGDRPAQACRDIRRGEFEGRRRKMAAADWAPDFGPDRRTRPPAPVIGARMPLIAYNINLATDRLDVAKKIAAAIRDEQRRAALRQGDGHARWGPRHRAGVDEPDQLREDADASGSSTLVKREAARTACDVLESEIVGLDPGRAPWLQRRLKLPDETWRDSLERRLETKLETEQRTTSRSRELLIAVGFVFYSYSLSVLRVCVVCRRDAEAPSSSGRGCCARRRAPRRCARCCPAARPASRRM